MMVLGIPDLLLLGICSTARRVILKLLHCMLLAELALELSLRYLNDDLVKLHLRLRKRLQDLCKHVIGLLLLLYQKIHWHLEVLRQTR
jgi:hypothetical protein